MAQRRELQTLLNAAPVGALQWRVIICCFLVVMLDGFDTAAIGFIAPDIRVHWQLSASDLAPLFGAGLLGLTAGALLCGPLSDRLGRKRVIEFCVALFGLFSLLSAFSTSLEMLVILRFLTGLGLGGAMPNTITMTSEYLPARRRGALVTLMFCGFTLGSALGGVVSAVNVLCSRGDHVLVHSPTYIGFTHALEDNGYHIVHSPLRQDTQGTWRMDLADMEEKIVQYKIHTAILCSPHNPCGRVWERWELERVMELYKKYDVYVISDEIWSDLILPGYRHIPTQTVSEDAKQRTVAMYAPSKTFNLAGLVGSYSIIYNSWLRDRVAKEATLCHYNAQNVLSMYALIGAYRDEGIAWLEELRQVLSGNVDYACDFIRENFPGVHFSKPQGTYMLFIDCTGWCQAHGVTLDEILERCWSVGVAVQDGRPFHGANAIRINLALPKARVEEAFRRMEQYAFI